MHFTLQQLRLFEAVARHLSYTRAAEELFLTQPAVSIQLKRLEEQAGLPLFDMVGKKIFLTSAGDIMNSAARDILARVSDLNTDLETLKGEVKGRLQVSVVTTSKYFMPHLLGGFLNTYTDVEPALTFSNREHVIQRLYSNEDDFVVMGQVPDDDKLVAHPFLDNVLVPIAHPEHHLVNEKKITLDQLIKERFLERETGSGTRKAFERLLAEKGLSFEPYMELGSGEAIKQAVMAGLGVAVLSLHAIELELAAKKLTVLDIEGFPMKRPWYAVHLKGKKLSLVASTFLEYILAEQQIKSEVRYR